jgi:tetratricopeptide (TPR) repeat protein
MFKFLNDSLQRDPKNSEMLFVRGLGFNDLKKYDSAITDFNSALKYLNYQVNKPFLRDDRTADSADIMMMRAYCYDMIDDVDKSVSDYRYLQNAKPNDFMYSIVVARLYIKHKEFEKAQAEINSLKEQPQNERGLVYQAVLFNEMERYNEALNAVDETLKKYPGSIEALITKAKILDKLGNKKDACQTISEAKNKMTIDYFRGHPGYMQDFEDDINNLKNLYCQ